MAGVDLNSHLFQYLLGHMLAGSLWFTMGLWHLLSCIIASAEARARGGVYKARVYHRGNLKGPLGGCML